MSSGTAMLRYTLCNRVKSKMSLNLRNRTKRTKVEQVRRKAEAKVNFCLFFGLSFGLRPHLVVEPSAAKIGAKLTHFPHTQNMSFQSAFFSDHLCLIHN